MAEENGSLYQGLRFIEVGKIEVPLYFVLLALCPELHKVLQEIFQLYCTIQPKKISMLPPPKWLKTPRWSEVSKIHIHNHSKQYKAINWNFYKEGGRSWNKSFTLRGDGYCLELYINKESQLHHFTMQFLSCSF